MEDDLIHVLLAADGVTALVKSRVLPVSRPQGSRLPAVTLQTVSGAPIYTDDGELGLASARVQVDCWAATYAAAKTLARAVTAALSAYEGTQGNTHFASVFLDAERDDREGGVDSAEYLFRTSLDFIVWHQQA